MTTMETPSCCRLVELAPEILQLILGYLDPHDLVSFGRTCTRARSFTDPANHLLWRASFLHVFDDPWAAWQLLLPTARTANRPKEESWDWYTETSRRLTAFASVYNLRQFDQLSDPESVVKTLLDVLDTASVASSNAEGDPSSLNLIFLDRLFQDASHAEKIVHDFGQDLKPSAFRLTLPRDPGRPVTRSMIGRQLARAPSWASRFHVLYGCTEREGDSLQAKASARALVYDWNVTGPSADFGPFLKDGSGMINWNTLEASSSLIHRVFEIIRIAHSLKKPYGFGNSLPGQLPPSIQHKDDWAGINRTYYGTYAFLDYRTLVSYNFANTDETGYAMDLSRNDEAYGDLMRLELEMSDDVELREDSRLQTKLPYCKDLPKLYFKGISRDRPSGRPYILVRGCVCLVPGGREVRWRFIISYAGSDQWWLEGVQPGGIRSGGIYGLWTHVEHDEQGGPTGPFCYFPIECCEPLSAG